MSKLATTESQIQQVPVGAETNEIYPNGVRYDPPIRLYTSYANADHFYATVILFSEEIATAKEEQTAEEHVYKLPAVLIEPYRAKINQRIDKPGGYSAVAVYAISCRSVVHLGICIKASGQEERAAPIVPETSTCCLFLKCCACCLLLPLTIVYHLLLGVLNIIAPCSRQCMNSSCSICRSDGIVVNNSIAKDIIRYMVSNGGERQFRVDDQLQNISVELLTKEQTQLQQQLRQRMKPADADHFYATVTSYPNGFSLEPGEVGKREHVYMLPSVLLEPYREVINKRIDEVGDYCAVAIFAPSCRSVGHMMISIKAPSEASLPMQEDSCLVYLLWCARCFCCPLLFVCDLLLQMVSVVAPCSLQLMNYAFYCFRPAGLIVNTSLCNDIIRYMESNGGEEQFRTTHETRHKILLTLESWEKRLHVRKPPNTSTDYGMG